MPLRYPTEISLMETFFFYRISTVVATLATPNNLGDPNGNNDSGYAHSQADSVIPDSPRIFSSTRGTLKRNGASMDTEMR